jgi:hypothetical protein
MHPRSDSIIERQIVVVVEETDQHRYLANTKNSFYSTSISNIQ